MAVYKNSVPFGNIVTDGLVLNLDATNINSYPGSGTTWTDTSFYRNNGTLTNGPTFLRERGRGSIVFDGVNDFVATNNYSLDFGTQSFTLAAWIRTSNNTQQGKIINKGQSSAFPLGSKGYSIRFFDTASFSVGDGTIFTSTPVLNVNDIANNVWTFMTGICNRELLTQFLYINGVVNNSGSISYGSISNPQAELTIGNLDRGIYGPKAEFFNGNISAVQIYNRALSAQEVLQNYNALKSRFGL